MSKWCFSFRIGDDVLFTRVFGVKHKHISTTIILRHKILDIFATYVMGQTA